jgi:hypothetical protein
MKRITVINLLVSGLVFLVWCGGSWAGESKKRVCPFPSSLHHTTRGMAYWYDKSRGGLETLTNIPYAKLGCKNCHVSSCCRCHVAGESPKAFYSAAASRHQTMCLECHSREAITRKIDGSRNQLDVHFSQGMECVDCHTPREMHGDGIPYVSMKQAGAMDARCENCHDEISKSTSHTIHKGKLECKSCHVRHVVSCANCHFETLIKEKKKRFIPVFDWIFLMNYRGKVTSANLQTFVVKGNKTFLMLAPQFTHSVMKPGRKCESCHGTEIAKQVKNGKLTLTWIEHGKFTNLKGVIPVVEGVRYKNAYQDYRNGEWFPIENPPQPDPHYVGFGKPLSRSQLEKLVLSKEALEKLSEKKPVK